MANIRTIEQIAAKYSAVTPQRTADYEAGVRSPKADWATQTLAAEDSWQTGVQNAISEKRFGKGVRAAGTEKWQRGAVEKGSQRWGPGVQMAQPAYAQGFAPYRDAIERLTLSPRYARRDPRNLNRVKQVVDAMIATARGRGTT